MAYLIRFSNFGDIDTYEPEPNIRPLDGDMTQLSLVDPTQGDGTMHYGVPKTALGKAVRPENMPTKARREGTGTNIYPQLDFHHMNAAALVSEKAKAVIEKLEPERHQFFPVKVTIGKDDQPYGQYYLFYVGNRLDTLAKNLSGPYNARGVCKGFERDNDGRVVLDAEKIGDHQMWGETFVVSSGWIWISDVAAETLQTEDLTGLGGFKHVPETKDLKQ